ncbi:MAG: polyribonucleotide nucleotidyltransferase, partial [Gemmatimonadales bacterium]
MHRIETTFAGRPLVLETGRLARQSAGSVLVQFGETVVLAAVTVSPKESNLPFFPLTVEYREKTYAAGKIPGGFIKREGRPSDKEILAARIIDRSIRPLFPEGFKNEVQVFVTVVSADQEHDADVLGAYAASAALSISPIPWNGPLATVRVGRVEGKWILNPTFHQLEFSEIDMSVSGSGEFVDMVEGGALEVSEELVVEALKVAQKGIKELRGHIETLVKKTGAKKMDWNKPAYDEAVVARVRELAEKDMAKAINHKDKAGRAGQMKAVRDATLAAIAGEFPEKIKDAEHEIEEIEYRTMRTQVLDKGER